MEFVFNAFENLFKPILTVESKKLLAETIIQRTRLEGESKSIFGFNIYFNKPEPDKFVSLDIARTLRSLGGEVRNLSLIQNNKTIKAAFDDIFNLLNLSKALDQEILGKYPNLFNGKTKLSELFPEYVANFIGFINHKIAEGEANPFTGGMCIEQFTNIFHKYNGNNIIEEAKDYIEKSSVKIADLKALSTVIKTSLETSSEEEFDDGTIVAERFSENMLCERLKARLYSFLSKINNDSLKDFIQDKLINNVIENKVEPFDKKIETMQSFARNIESIDLILPSYYSFFEATFIGDVELKLTAAKPVGKSRGV